MTPSVRKQSPILEYGNARRVKRSSVTAVVRPTVLTIKYILATALFEMIKLFPEQSGFGATHLKREPREGFEKAFKPEERPVSNVVLEARSLGVACLHTQCLALLP